jgi:hypothetical protein
MVKKSAGEELAPRFVAAVKAAENSAKSPVIRDRHYDP